MMKPIFLKCRHIILFKTFQQLLPTRLASNNTLQFLKSSESSQIARFSWNFHDQAGVPYNAPQKVPASRHSSHSCLLCPPHWTTSPTGRSPSLLWFARPGTVLKQCTPSKISAVEWSTCTHIIFLKKKGGGHQKLMIMIKLKTVTKLATMKRQDQRDLSLGWAEWSLTVVTA